MEDERLKNKNFIDAWKKAFSGIWYSIRTQRNIKIQLVIALIIILACICLKLSYIEVIILVFATMLVIAMEVMNTAVETVVNLCTEKYHPLAKIAKDVSAGAVVITAINAVIIAIIMFVGKLIQQ